MADDRPLFEMLGGLIARNYDVAILEQQLTQSVLLSRITANTQRRVNPVFGPTRVDFENIVADEFIAEVREVVARYEARGIEIGIWGDDSGGGYFVVGDEFVQRELDP